MDGLKARDVNLDLWDIVALNAMEEIPGYYVPWFNWRHKNAPRISRAPANCSAFVATGSWTKGRQIVMAHNNWTDYLNGARWRIIFDIVPAQGNHMLMDGFPGIIASDDDFGVNSAGMMVTETTISAFFGFDPAGKPEFMRARKALQYANSIDDYVRIMMTAITGGTQTIGSWVTARPARLPVLSRGCNTLACGGPKMDSSKGPIFPAIPQCERRRPLSTIDNRSLSPNARRIRWQQLLRQNKGKIDLAHAQQFLADHYDTLLKQDAPSERTLCGHIELSPRGFKGWLTPHYPAGTVQNKVIDSEMAENMMFAAYRGHACGRDFKARPFLAQHREFEWTAPALIDLDAGGWAIFRATDKK